MTADPARLEPVADVENPTPKPAALSQVLPENT